MARIAVIPLLSPALILPLSELTADTPIIRREIGEVVSHIEIRVFIWIRGTTTLIKEGQNSRYTPGY